MMDNFTHDINHLPALVHSAEDIAVDNIDHLSSPSSSEDILSHHAEHLSPPDVSSGILEPSISEDSPQTPGVAQTTMGDSTSVCSAVISGSNTTSPSKDTKVDLATIPFTTNSLRKISPELRQMIFEMSGVSKETLAAFIGDQVLYQEALKVYWDTTRIAIPYDLDLNWQFSKDCPLSKKSLNSIKMVQLMWT